MNSDKNLEVAKSYFTAFREGDPWSIIPKVYKEDVEYLCFSSVEMCPETKEAIPWAGLWKGHQGVADFQKMLNSNFDILEFDDRYYVAKEEHVGIFGNFKFRIKSNQKVLKCDFAVHMQFREGKVAKYHFYEDTYAVAASFRQGGTWEIENNGLYRKLPAA